VGKDSLQVTFELLPWTTLRGRVVDPDGNPASNVPVEILGPRPGDIGRGEIVSGSDGSFTFTKLLPGAFTLLARPRAVKVAPQSGVRLQTVATFYPSALERSQAQPIACEEPAKRPDTRLSCAVSSSRRSGHREG
jgi:hypothetical protein